VQQVHPRLVGLGVGQREEGRQLEARGVAGVTALRNTGGPIRDLTEAESETLKNKAADMLYSLSVPKIQSYGHMLTF